jgi:hypothetical protein
MELNKVPTDMFPAILKLYTVFLTDRASRAEKANFKVGSQTGIRLELTRTNFKDS